jgi:hypothetical protein
VTREDTILSQLMVITEKVGGVLSGQATFSGRLDHIEKRIDEVFELHAKCSGPIAFRAVEDLRSEFDQHLDRTTTTRNKGSDDKISRPPKARGISDRTLQLLAILAIVAIGGGAMLIQILGV